MPEQPHAWELPVEEKKKLLPSVNPEFFNSPHAWEVEENESERKSTGTGKDRKSTGTSDKKDKKRLERASSSNTSIFDRLGTKPEPKRVVKGHVVTFHDKQEPSIFDRMGKPPTDTKQVKPRERIVTKDTFPKKNIQKPDSKIVEKLVSTSPPKREIKAPKSRKPQMKPPSPIKTITEPEKEIKFIPIEQIQDVFDWADDTSPMDYTRVPTWK